MGVCGESEKNRKINKESKENDENNITGIIEGEKAQTPIKSKAKKGHNIQESKQSFDVSSPSPQTVENSKKNLLKNKRKDDNEKKEKNSLDLSNYSKKDKNNSINENPIEIINYDDFNIDKIYYISCPKCKSCQPYIENVEYDSEINDFRIKYICCCELSYDIYKEVYLSSIINPIKPENKCKNHKDYNLKFFCINCKKIICELCKDESHKQHDVVKNNILFKADIILKIAEEKKDKFKGYEILKKIFQNYRDDSEDIEENKLKEKTEINFENKILRTSLLENSVHKNEENDNKSENKINGDDTIKNNENKNVNNDIIFDKKNIKDKNTNPQYNQEEISIENLKKINPIDEQVIQDFNRGNDSYINKDDINKYNQNNSFNNQKLKSNQNNYPFQEKEKVTGKNIFEINNSTNNNNENYEFKEFKCIKTLEGHKEKVVSLILLESGNIATGSYDSSIYIWDISKGIMINKKEEKGYVFCLLEFEKNMLLSGTSENNIDLWDLSSKENKYIYKFKGHQLWVNCLVKCNDKIFASAGNDANIIIWDFYEKKFIKYLQGHRDCILSLIKLNDGKLCSSSADLTIKIWDWKNNKCLSTLSGHEKWVKCLYQLKDGTILSGSDDKSIKIWKDYECKKSIKEHTLSIRALCQIDDNFWASGSFDKTIKIWDIKNYKCLQNISGHTGNIICIIKLKNNMFASCSCDKTIKIWDNNY